MSVERNPFGGGIDRETTFRARDFPTRYDLLLAVLPLPLLIGILGAHVVSLPVALGAGVGGLPSAFLLGYGLFVASPTPTDRSGPSNESARGGVTTSGVVRNENP